MTSRKLNWLDLISAGSHLVAWIRPKVRCVGLAQLQLHSHLGFDRHLAVEGW